MALWMRGKTLGSGVRSWEEKKLVCGEAINASGESKLSRQGVRHIRCEGSRAPCQRLRGFSRRIRSRARISTKTTLLLLHRLDKNILEYLDKYFVDKSTSTEPPFTLEKTILSASAFSSFHSPIRSPIIPPLCLLSVSFHTLILASSIKHSL